MFKLLTPVLFPFLVLSAGAAQGQIHPLSDPTNTGGWVLNSSMSDEFDGDTLNLYKWNNLGLDGNYYGEWKGRAPSQYNPLNVSVGGGNLTITSKWDPNFKFSTSPSSTGGRYGHPAPVTTGGICSKTKVRYGYLEMRCRAADGPVSSSFWTTGEGGEIDVFEHYGKNPGSMYSDGRFHASFHDWRKGSATFGKRIWTNDHQLGFRVADDFHVYGLLWAENLVKIYVDGRLVTCITKEAMGNKWVATSEQKIWIDSETFDWEVKPAMLKSSDFGNGKEFTVDYCRVWQNAGHGVQCESRTNLLANPGFEQDLTAWNGTAEVCKDAHTGRSSAVLRSSGSVEQNVSVKPNTTYILSAWVRSPETNESDLWFNSYLGVRGNGNAKTLARYFFPYFHTKSLQFTTGVHTENVVVFFTNKPHGKQAIIDDVELVEAPMPSK